MTVDVKAWIKRHGLEKSAKLLGVGVRMANRIAAGHLKPTKVMENLAMALDRIEELEAQLKRKDLPLGRPSESRPGRPLPPCPAPVLRDEELQTGIDWIRGRS